MSIALDCGELLPGHCFIITGLRRDGLSDDAMHADLSGHRPGDRSEPMVSVTYDLVPGLSEDEMHAGVHVDATVELRPTPPGGSPGRGIPSEQGARPGQAVTSGAFGPFRCPNGTSEVVLNLRSFQVLVSADGSDLNADVGDRLGPEPRPSGQAVIALADGAAGWVPDTRRRP